jgi:hypothetical protein
MTCIEIKMLHGNCHLLNKDIIEKRTITIFLRLSIVFCRKNCQMDGNKKTIN